MGLVDYYKDKCILITGVTGFVGIQMIDPGLTLTSQGRSGKVPTLDSLQKNLSHHPKKSNFHFCLA